MRTLTEPSREIPIVLEADVVVCGGGPGGFPAAIAAARHGAQTVLIERYGFMGGLATAGLVAPILAHTASESHIPIVAGILKERRADARPRLRPHLGGGSRGVGRAL